MNCLKHLMLEPRNESSRAKRDSVLRGNTSGRLRSVLRLGAVTLVFGIVACGEEVETDPSVTGETISRFEAVSGTHSTKRFEEVYDGLPYMRYAARAMSAGGRPIKDARVEWIVKPELPATEFRVADFTSTVDSTYESGFWTLTHTGDDHPAYGLSILKVWLAYTAGLYFVSPHIEGAKSSTSSPYIAAYTYVGEDEEVTALAGGSHQLYIPGGEEIPGDGIFDEGGGSSAKNLLVELDFKGNMLYPADIDACTSSVREIFATAGINVRWTPTPSAINDAQYSLYDGSVPKMRWLLNVTRDEQYRDSSVHIVIVDREESAQYQDAYGVTLDYYFAPPSSQTTTTTHGSSVLSTNAELTM